KRLVPNDATIQLHSRWEALLPTLIDDYLYYIATSHGKCIFLLDFRRISVKICGCRSMQQVLVRHGLFPTAPSQSRIAVSIDLLTFYGALFERSCDAINALALALNSFYSRRGFDMVHKTSGEKIKEPFRKSLGYASQWFDILRLKVEDQVLSSIAEADNKAQEYHALTSNGKKNAKSESTITDNDHPDIANYARPSECDSRLARLCPACFGGNKFGKTLVSEGADFHIATDGNFHHRHSVQAGAGVPFHKDPRHIVPSAFVNKVGEHIESVRKKGPRKNPTRASKVPEEAIDECERSYEAASGDKKKAMDGNERYDDQGLMSLVCRHDVPLFMANIDTPGEQQKYAVALVLWFFRHVPTNATVTVLYDIGCALDRSLSLHDMIPESALNRVRFTTTAMHAYGHQWSCQLEYNPRLCKGLGLTDGEGVERTWSKSRKLIGIVRSSSRARRIWVIDRQVSSIAADVRADLGTWMRRRQRVVKERIKEAKAAIKKSGHTEDYLRGQWETQKQEQLESKIYTPTKVKADISCVLILQEEVEMLQTRLASAKKGLKSKRKQTQKSIDSFESQIEGLQEDIEEIFLSLNIHASYPELEGLGADFVRTLILASELKETIRRLAIESFCELGRLDQAVRGVHQPLGTKLHQQTRKAMAKRSPALIAKVRKFNSYCKTLRQLCPPNSKLKLPTPLSTQVAKLRDNTYLMEDVWITPVEDEKERPWMNDSTVRAGIQAVLKLDRCIEEQKRLGMEADNMCRQFGRELLAVEIALRNQANASIAQELINYRNGLHYLRTPWSSLLASSVRYNSHIQQSTTLADIIAGNNQVLQSYNVSMLSSGSRSDSSDLSDSASDESETENSTSGSLDADSHLIDVDEDDYEGAASTVSTVKLRDYSGYTGASRKNNRILFEKKDLQILENSTALLNDVCINGCSQLLKTKYREEAENCAVFSTYDLVRWRNKKKSLHLDTVTGSAPDLISAEIVEMLWKNSKHTQFWQKRVWILPIHRPGHWVLCVAYPMEQLILLYDSLGQEVDWKNEVMDVHAYFSELVQAANGNGICLKLPSWTSKPAFLKPVQTNGHDCGLWVLLWIAASLRGFQT
ncbi:hypothetical protein BJ165DRAFT_1329754, partial [Panaeolus papilionaceus]